MKTMTEREIAANIRQYLLELIKSTIRSEADANEYCCRHARVCLTNEDMSDDPYWFRVDNKEQVIEIKKNFCAGVDCYNEDDNNAIIDAVITGYHIDFSRPTYVSYDLNLQIPILN